ncbi:MAG: SDR family oxidoreductase [Archangium sp.]
MNLKDSSIVVVGGSSGIGRGIAEEALRRGARVTLVGRDETRLEAVRREIKAHAAVVADVADEAAVQSLAAKVGEVDHLVTTAISGAGEKLTQMKVATVREVLDSKVLAALLLARHVKLRGSFTLTAGVAAERPGPSGAAVSAANGALFSLARALALELAPVRVNVISPGWVDTALWDKLGGDKQAMFARVAERLPVKRIGTTADLAHAAMFLMENGFMTGAVLPVDGGHRLV